MPASNLYEPTKPRCTARIKNQWFHMRDFTGEDHQCPRPIWCDRWCKIHHPAQIIDTLRKREEKLAKELARVRAKLEHCKPPPVDISAEV